MAMIVSMSVIVSMFYFPSKHADWRNIALSSTVPCRKAALMMLSVKPTAPVIRTSFGCSTSVKCINIGIFTLHVEGSRTDRRHESFKRLQENAQAKSSKEDTIEECSQQPSSLPAEAEFLW